MMIKNNIKTMEKIKRVLSGINPSSSAGLHLGNYFGAVKPHVDFQDEGECFYFIANLHALNSVFNGDDVRANTENVFIEYLAFGIDPEKTIFYVQSDIEQIPYFQTILNNVISHGQMKRMHAFKDKLQKGTDAEQINMGLFNYPILMAADILLFKPDIIPVGEDQTQHVEVARDIAQSFNKRYGEILKMPKLYVKKEVARVRGTDGERKMSKSLGNDLPVCAQEAEIRKRIMAITTDPARIHPDDPGDPSKNPCFDYLSLMDFDSKDLDEMKLKYEKGTIGDVEIKEKTFETFMEYFREFRIKKRSLLKDMDYVRQVRKRGIEKAEIVAEENLRAVRDVVGV